MQYSTQIMAWINDVHQLLAFEKKLDFDYFNDLDTIDFDNLSYDIESRIPHLKKMIDFEMYAVNFKRLAKEFTEVIKPTLPDQWFGASTSLEVAVLNLSAHSSIFKKISVFLTKEHKMWKPKYFVENTWAEMEKLHL